MAGTAKSPAARPKRAVVIGGGTGAPVSIRALLALGLDVSAVVTMADDGGSSGLLREYIGVLPPGDIRKCLVSMAADPESPWARAFVSRLAYDHDHPLGNLILATLSEVTGSLPEAIELCSRLLQARGRVYPSTLANIGLNGTTVDGRQLAGQAMLTRSDSALATVELHPQGHQAYPEALAVIRDADLIVLGPGSLFTSIIPNLLVPGVSQAIAESPAVRLFLCSLADMQGETRGMDASHHVEALLRHGMAGSLDVVVAHRPKPHSQHRPGIKPVAIDEAACQRIEQLGPRLIVRHLADPERPTWHSLPELSALFAELLSAAADDAATSGSQLDGSQADDAATGGSQSGSNGGGMP